MLKQHEISQANFVTVKEIFAAEVRDSVGNTILKLLTKLDAVTTASRAENGSASGGQEIIGDNLLHHDNRSAFNWGRSHKFGTPSVTDVDTDSL